MSLLSSTLPFRGRGESNLSEYLPPAEVAPNRRLPAILLMTSWLPLPASATLSPIPAKGSVEASGGKRPKLH